MGNSSKKPFDDKEFAAIDTSQWPQLTIEELAILSNSFAYIKQNCHKVALKMVSRIVDTVPQSISAFRIESQGGGSFHLMNQGLILLTGFEKCVERADDVLKLRQYTKQLTSSHSKLDLKADMLIKALEPCEEVILDCLQTGYEHSNRLRRQSTISSSSSISNGSRINRRISIVGESSHIQLLDSSHMIKCKICRTWKIFFTLLKLCFNPKYELTSNDNSFLTSCNRNSTDVMLPEVDRSKLPRSPTRRSSATDDFEFSEAAKRSQNECN